MEELHELAFVYQDLVSRKVLKPVDFQGKAAVLLQTVINHPRCNEDIAAQMVYAAKPREKRFIMLKKKLRQKLQSTLLQMLSLDDQAMPYEDLLIYKQNLAIANLLIDYNLYHFAKKEVIKTVKNLQIPHAPNLYQDWMKLGMKCSSIMGNPELFNQYKSVHEHLEIYLHWQQKIDFEIQLLMSQWKYRSSLLQSNADALETWLKRIKKIKKRYPVDQLSTQFLVFKTSLCLHLPGYHSPKLDKKVSQALSKDFDFFIFINYQKLLLRMGEWERYHELEKLYAKKITYANFYRFDLSKLDFQYAVFQKDGRKAEQIWSGIVESTQFQLLSEEDLAIWNLLKAYAAFRFIKMNGQQKTLFEIPGVNQLLLQSRPLFKDKAGYLQLVYLLKLLLIIEKGDIEWFIQEIDGFKMFIQRNLKDSLEARLNLLYRYIVKLAKNAYSPSKCVELNDDFLDLVAIHPYRDLNEWIPVEEVWEYIYLKLRHLVNE